MMIQMDSMAKSANEGDERNGRRTRKSPKCHRTGMISTIQQGPITMKSTETVKKSFERFENGRTDFMPIDWLGGVAILQIARMSAQQSE